MSFVFAILGQLLGCGVPLPAPIVESVEPGRGWNGEDTPIAILGEGFVPQVTFDASSTEGEADLDRDFEVFLVDEAGVAFPLTGVSVASYEQLTAFVTAGLVPGLYDVEVVSPSGTRTALPDAYVVSATRADHLTLEVTSVAFDVGMLIPIEVKLWDPNGERVLEDVEVELRASGDDGPFLVDWGSGGLEDRVDSVDGSSITGRLGSDGYAPFALRVFVPQTVTFTVTPLSDPGLLGDELKIAITPTADFQVDIALPSEEFVAEAGVPFDAVITLEDELGNPLPERFEELVVEDACGGWFAKVLVTGSAVVPVTLGVPTGEAPCLVQSLLVEGTGTSEAFTVVAGPPFRFRVSAGPVVLPAGDAVRLVIEAEDAVGNPTPWSGVLTWSDGVTGGSLEDCTVAGTQHLCDLVRTVARPADIIRVEGDDGTFGISPPFAVVPGTDIDALGVTVPPSVVAGETWILDVNVLDAFGNAIDPAGYPVSDFTITDDRGEVDCLFATFSPNLTASWDCTLYTAGTAVLHVAGPDGVTADAATIVNNGPPAVAWLDAPAMVGAGELFVISGDVEDAWGNPVIVPALTVIDLTDDTLTLSPTLAVLDPSGSFDEAASVTAAGLTRVSAWYDGGLIGTSDDILVVAAEAARLRIEPAEPWGWIGEPLRVQVEALDAFDNRADWTGAIDLDGAGISLADLAVVDGYAEVELAWSAPVASEQLDGATADLSLAGESRAFHVVADCDTDPAPVLLFAGEPVARGCWDPVEGASSLTGSFTGSTGAGSAIVGYALAVGSEVSTGAVIAPVVTVHASGRFDVRGLVMQADGCGAEVASTAWVGADDGNPVGPLLVTPVTTPIDVLAGLTDVEVRDARDCSGDVAAFGSVFVRSDLGELSGVSFTGAGLALALDGFGNGAATLSAASTPMGGAATLSAWTASGGAAGVAAVEIVGDDLRPVVWEQDPEGETLELISAIRLTFSEPLRAASVTPAAATLLGPFGAELVSTTLEGESTLVVTPASPIDGTQGAWVLTIGTELRDAAGNRLDGEYTGAASDWVAELGVVGAVVAGAACSEAADVIRPDGDDGPGAEADTLVVTASSSVQPDRWEIAVRTGGADVVRRRQDAASAVEALVWDARDASGRVVSNGVYDMDITPLDAAGNRGAGCGVTTTVDNPVVIP